MPLPCIIVNVFLFGFPVVVTIFLFGLPVELKFVTKSGQRKIDVPFPAFLQTGSNFQAQSGLA
jgi:hypothetical protein